jgi:uncharacterized metal-binding protein YceD (DUF177 family)
VSVNKSPRPEFSRPIGRERLAEAPLKESIRATADERRALARRLELVALDGLRAEFDAMSGQGNGLLSIHGRLAATVTQLCVITLEPMKTTLNESFEMVYAFEDGPADACRMRAGLDPNEELPEVIGPEGLDFGELAAQYLSLALDPFPRQPGIGLEDVWSGAGEKVEPDKEEPSPFAVLARWRAEH